VILMTHEMLLGLGQQALLLMVLASLPPVLASLVVGFAMSVFQAITQIQEPTLSVVPKLGAAVLSLVMAGPWIAGQLAVFTSQLLMAMPTVGS
jgi:flagellar biosynthesis protein FliQ